ncbi:MAG: hypothetical protein ACRDA4_05715 [Filifactoraceae bacterium]
MMKTSETEIVIDLKVDRLDDIEKVVKEIAKIEKEYNCSCSLLKISVGSV